MNEQIVTIITNNILDILIAIITLIVSYYIIPSIKNDLVPWLKDKRLYDTIKIFVQAAEKLADSGAITKEEKKNYVKFLLEKQGIQITECIDSFIESCVKELDFVIDTTKEVILEKEIK